MNGNISKAKGFKGDTGPQGPRGPQGIQGTQGEKGDTPSIVFRYDPETGNLYYSSDGILVDKEYIKSQNLATKKDVKDEVKAAFDKQKNGIILKDIATGKVYKIYISNGKLTMEESEE